MESPETSRRSTRNKSLINNPETADIGPDCTQHRGAGALQYDQIAGVWQSVLNTSMPTRSPRVHDGVVPKITFDRFSPRTGLLKHALRRAEEHWICADDVRKRLFRYESTTKLLVSPRTSNSVYQVFARRSSRDSAGLVPNEERCILYYTAMI